MKKFYNEPEMNISTFSAMDVVTTSGGVVGATATADEFTKAEVGTKATISYDTIAKDLFVMGE